MGWIGQRWMETLSATLYVLIKTYQSMKAFALFFSTLPSHHWNYFKWQNRIITCIDTDMDVSENSGTPKSSIQIGFSIINHPFWGTSIFGNTHIYIYYYINV